MEINDFNDKLQETFNEIKKSNPNMSLDSLLYAVYNSVNGEYNKSFDILRTEILKANNIDELAYYTKNVNPKLKEYIANNIFPEYAKNDGGHNIAHIKEVIRRSFALNDTFNLKLNDNMIYTIACCHDWGKYIDHANHHMIAAQNFISDENFKQFFSDEERKIIKEAIEDHRSSKQDEPRTVYGKLISSADRNTKIDIVFVRSFFVAHERTPDYKIEDYLDFTINRLSKKYSESDPENMFYQDVIYKVFLGDMRSLLKDEVAFKNRYCEINHIESRDSLVKENKGAVEYLKY